MRPEIGPGGNRLSRPSASALHDQHGHHTDDGNRQDSTSAQADDRQ